MSVHRAERSIAIAATPELCFATASDYSTFPVWQQAVIGVDILERDAQGRGSLVEFVTDVKLRKVRYRLRYHHDHPRRIWWEFVEGDGVAHIDGEYRFEPQDGGTLVSYTLGIDPGVPVPGVIARRANATVMKRSVEDLRDEVERRLGGR